MYFYVIQHFKDFEYKLLIFTTATYGEKSQVPIPPSNVHTDVSREQFQYVTLSLVNYFLSSLLFTKTLSNGSNVSVCPTKFLVQIFCICLSSKKTQPELHKWSLLLHMFFVQI